MLLLSILTTFSAKPTFLLSDTTLYFLESVMAAEDELIEEEFEGFENEVTDEQGTKRKAEDSEPKRQKSKTRKRRKITEEDIFDEENELNVSIGDMDSRLLVDHMAQRTKRFEPKLTMVEAEDRYVPQEAVLDTSSWNRPRATMTIPAFLKKYAGENLSSAPEEKGCPHTIIVTGAALRAADLARILRKYQAEDSKVGKLFAKHIKMEEAKEFCKKNRYGPFLNLEAPGLHSDSMSLGVGTPQRISDLLDDGALSSNHLRSIVVDASHVDQKKRTIFDMRDSHLPLVKLLTRSEFRTRYEAPNQSERLRLLFY